MKPIRLAVIFDQQIGAGGGYQQELNAGLLTRELTNELALVIYFTTLKENIAPLVGHGIEARLIEMSLAEKVRGYLRGKVITSRFLKVLKWFEQYTPFEKCMINHQIDLVYFVSPCSLARSLEELNYITTIWDLSHRDEPEFPEVRYDRVLEARDLNYAAILPRATAIFVDSELGKTNAIRRYGVDEERVHLMPFEAAVATRCHLGSAERENVNIREKYQLNVPYIFYPAQFWAHKNHVYILEGLRALEDRHGLKIGAIFSGCDKGNRTYIEKYAQSLSLISRVRFAGFVSNEAVLDLYQQSVALVMPTYFGPTNLPPLEAFELGVPVLYSDKAGLRDQVGDAALLMDLADPTSMANHLKNLIEDGQLREHLISAGRSRLKYFDSVDRVGILRSVIEGYRWRRLCWE